MAVRRAGSKLQDWCGLQGFFGLQGAPVLEFRHFMQR
jgi:hypothetical protein